MMTSMLSRTLTDDFPDLANVGPAEDRTFQDFQDFQDFH
jgi:hypothetical protein